jgi:hypothetical protein
MPAIRIATEDKDLAQKAFRRTSAVTCGSICLISLSNLSSRAQTFRLPMPVPG